LKIIGAIPIKVSQGPSNSMIRKCAHVYIQQQK